MRIEISVAELTQLLHHASPVENETALAVERLTDVTRLHLRDSRETTRLLRRLLRTTQRAHFEAVEDDEAPTEDDDDDELDLEPNEVVREDSWN
jgi:DNA-binding transcriptional regulator YdaS (Cro superfamily)